MLIILQRLNRELEIWKRLSHSHVLTLLGVAHDAFGGHGYAMVCPWLENGSVSRWMEKCGDVLGARERLTLVRLSPPRRPDIFLDTVFRYARWQMAFLIVSVLWGLLSCVSHCLVHSQSIVHGDLSGVSIS